MKFKYRAKTKANKLVDGIVDAENEFISRDLLKARGLTVISLKSERFSANSIMAILNRVKSKDLVIYFRQLAVMVEASIPLIKALKVLSDQTDNPKLKMITEEIYQDVDSGSKLSEAMEKHVRVFSKFFVNIIKAGETSGRLEQVLNYLADQQEKDHDLASKIKGALIYPIVILVGMFGGGIGMMVTVMPKLVGIFEGMGAELPWQTRVIIASSDFLVDYWWFVIAVVVGIVVGLVYYGRTKQGRIVLGFIKLRIPVFGTMFRMMYIVQMMRSLHTLLIGGVTLVDSLEIVKDVVDNHAFEQLLDEARDQVNDGHPLAEVFANSKLVPAVVSNMIDIGEQSGRMDQMLERVSAFYQKELDAIASNIMVLMEPIIMVALGFGVAVMVSAIFVPLYNLPGF